MTGAVNVRAAIVVACTAWFVLSASLASKADEFADCGINDPARRQVMLAACGAIIQNGAVDNKIKSIAMNNRGHAYLSAGNLTQAMDEFRAALNLDRSNATAMLNLGNALVSFSDPVSGIAQYKAALATNGALWQAHWGLAIAYEKLGKDREALNALEATINSVPPGTQDHKTVVAKLKYYEAKMASEPAPKPNNIGSAPPAPEAASGGTCDRGRFSDCIMQGVMNGQPRQVYERACTVKFGC